MPTYERFEDLPVWQQAAKLYEAVDALLARPGHGIRRSFADQLDRAALSVSNNIAEGFERGTTNELLMFIYIARGSAGETRSMLCLLERKPRLSDLKSPISDLKSPISDLKSPISDLKSPISDFKSEISNLKSLAESCSRQLRGWAEHLQNSDIAGPRHLNDTVRRQLDSRHRADTFQKRLLATLPPNHPLRREEQP